MNSVETIGRFDSAGGDMRALRPRCLAGLLAGLLFCSGAAPAYAAGDDAARGKQAIVRYGCVACHAIPGIAGPRGGVGPPLDHIAKRAYIAGVLPNSRANMVRWLQNPPQIDPRTAMPNLGISESEARDMTAYLYTLD